MNSRAAQNIKRSGQSEPLPPLLALLAERILPAIAGAAATCLMWWSIRTTSVDRSFFDKTLRRWLDLDPSSSETIQRKISIFPGIDAFRPEMINSVDTYFLMILLAIAVSPFLQLKALSRFLVALTMGLLFVAIGPQSLSTYVSLHLVHFLFTRRQKSSLSGALFLAVVFVVPFVLNRTLNFPFLNWGVGLFILEAPRLLLFQRENADGLLPTKLPIHEYLLLFFSPACSTSFAPQGYTHVFSRFRTVSARALYLGGTLAMLEAFFAFAVGHSLIRILAEAGELHFGLILDPELSRTLLHLNEIPDTAPAWISFRAIISAVFSGCLHLGVIFLMLMTANHFRIAIWRFMGFHVDSHFKFPYFGSSLAETWMRFSVHYRMCLTKVFYEPIFWKLERLALPVRVSFASVVSIVCGGVLFHTAQRGSASAFASSTVWYSLETIPYYLALGLGIGTSQLRILKFGRQTSRSPILRWAKNLSGAIFVILFLGFTHLLASPETGFNGWRVLRLLWSTIWKLNF